MKQKKLRKARKVESVIKASITNKRTKCHLDHENRKSHAIRAKRFPSTQPNSIHTPEELTIWECVSCAQTCLGKRVFCFTYRNVSPARCCIIEADYKDAKQKAKKNDELQNNISNISLSRSLHIIVHNHW